MFKLIAYCLCFANAQGHEIELLDRLTGGRVVPLAAGEDGSSGGGAGGTPAAEPPAAAGGTEAFRPSTVSFLRTLRSEEAVMESKSEDQEEGAGAADPAAAEATRRAFEGAVLAQWQRLRAMRVG